MIAWACAYFVEQKRQICQTSIHGIMSIILWNNTNYYHTKQQEKSMSLHYNITFKQKIIPLFQTFYKNSV